MKRRLMSMCLTLLGLFIMLFLLRYTGAIGEEEQNTSMPQELRDLNAEPMLSPFGNDEYAYKSDNYLVGKVLINGKSILERGFLAAYAPNNPLPLSKSAIGLEGKFRLDNLPPTKIRICLCKEEGKLGSLEPEDHFDYQNMNSKRKSSLSKEPSGQYPSYSPPTGKGMSLKKSRERSYLIAEAFDRYGGLAKPGVLLVDIQEGENQADVNLLVYTK